MDMRLPLITKEIQRQYEANALRIRFFLFDEPVYFELCSERFFLFSLNIVFSISGFDTNGCHTLKKR